MRPNHTLLYTLRHTSKIITPPTTIPKQQLVHAKKLADQDRTLLSEGNVLATAMRPVSHHFDEHMAKKLRQQGQFVPERWYTDPNYLCHFVLLYKNPKTGAIDSTTAHSIPNPTNPHDQHNYLIFASPTSPKTTSDVRNALNPRLRVLSNTQTITVPHKVDLEKLAQLHQDQRTFSEEAFRDAKPNALLDVFVTPLHPNFQHTLNELHNQGKPCNSCSSAVISKIYQHITANPVFPPGFIYPDFMKNGAYTAPNTSLLAPTGNISSQKNQPQANIS